MSSRGSTVQSNRGRVKKRRVEQVSRALAVTRHEPAGEKRWCEQQAGQLIIIASLETRPKCTHHFPTVNIDTSGSEVDQPSHKCYFSQTRISCQTSLRIWRNRKAFCIAFIFHHKSHANSVRVSVFQVNAPQTFFFFKSFQ